MIDPVLGDGAKEERVLEALVLEVALQILVWPQSDRTGMDAAVPLVQDERKGAALTLLVWFVALFGLLRKKHTRSVIMSRQPAIGIDHR